MHWYELQQVRLAGTGATAVTEVLPAGKPIGGKAAQFVFSPTGIVTGAKICSLATGFEKDGKRQVYFRLEQINNKDQQTGRQFTGDEEMVGDPRRPLPGGVDQKPNARRSRSKT